MTKKFSGSEQRDNSAMPVSSISLLAQQANPFAGLAKNQPETIIPIGQESCSKESMESTNGEVQAGNNIVLKQSSAQANPMERKEIDADLFSSLSSPGLTAPNPWWQNGPYNNSMAYNMQYQYPGFMRGPSFPNAPSSTNPFDINSGFNQGQAATFPSMESMPGAHTSMPTLQGISTTSFGQQMPGAGTYMGQNFYNNMPSSRQQNQGSSGGRRSMEMVGSFDINQQQAAYTYSFPSRAGNPFL